MGKRRESRKPPGGTGPPPDTGGSPTRRSRPPGDRGRGPRGSLRPWLRANWSDLRFLVVFALCMGAYYLLTLVPPVENGLFPAYLRWNAAASGALLRVVGEEVTVRDQALISAGGPSIQVERGCDAVEPSALFVSAVLASPVPFLSRLLAAATGTVLLMLLNLVRVASLFLIRVYWPEAFETIHLDVWQALFIFIAILLWGLWASRVASRQSSRRDATN